MLPASAGMERMAPGVPRLGLLAGLAAACSGFMAAAEALAATGRARGVALGLWVGSGLWVGWAGRRAGAGGGGEEAEAAGFCRSFTSGRASMDWAAAAMARRAL